MKIKFLATVLMLTCCVIPAVFASDITDQIDSSKLEQDIMEPNVVDNYIDDLNDYSNFSDPQASPTYSSKDKISYKFNLNGIRVINAKSLTEAEVASAYTKFKNKMIGFDDLKEISSNLNTIYKNKGYLLSFVIIPEQKINQSGVVSFVAVEGFINDIFIVDKTPEQYSKILVKYAEINLKGIPLKKDDFFKFFMLVEDLPGITIHPSMLPSNEKFGASALVLATVEKPVFGSVSYDNQASKRLGSKQQKLEFGINSISYGSQLKFDYARSNLKHTKRFDFKNASFKQKIGGYGTTLSIGLATQNSRPYLSDPEIRKFNYQSKSKYLTIGISHPVILTYKNRLDLSIQSSFIKNEHFTNNNVQQQDRLRSILLKADYKYTSQFFEKLGTSYLTLGYNQGFKGLGNKKT